MKKSTKETRTTKTVLIKNGRGEVTGTIEMFWSKACGWVTIPDSQPEFGGCVLVNGRWWPKDSAVAKNAM